MRHWTSKTAGMVFVGCMTWDLKWIPGHASHNGGMVIVGYCIFWMPTEKNGNHNYNYNGLFADFPRANGLD